jgi:hypothetical protein
MIARIALFGTAALAAALLAAPAYADDCAAPIAAMRLAPTRSYTATSISTVGGHPSTSQIVLVNGQLYLQIGGVWHLSHMSAQQMLATINDNLKTSKMTCTRGGSETVNGQSATIYMVHNVNHGFTSDNRVWISSAGLPVKTEVNLGASGGKIVSTYDYSHAAVPPGAK